MRMNQPVKPIHTHEGGRAQRINPKARLRRSLMSCMLWEKEFYEDGQSIAGRIHESANLCDERFVMQLAIEAREEGGLRHAPLWLAMSLVERRSRYAAATLAKVIRRPDELTEALAMYWKDGRRKLSAQLKKGLAQAFIKFDAYQLAKYNRDNAIKLRDVMFLTHPKAKNDEQQKAFDQLADRTLASPDTWEVALSSGADKKETFERLLTKNKLGSLAFLRNLRNMAEADVSKTLIRSKLATRDFKGVLPFQFLAAARAAPQFEREIDAVMVKAVEGMPKLKGHTILLVDVSVSMTWEMSSRSTLNRMDAASALAVLLEGICESVQIQTFSRSLVEVPPRSGMALVDAIYNSQPRSGTNLRGAINVTNTLPHDRLVVITDEQADHAPPAPSQKGYLINVASAKNGVGYGPWIHIDGFSERVVDYIQEYES